MTMIYTNPRKAAAFADWPYGSSRTTCTFSIETHPTRGQRAVRQTINPKTGKPAAKKALTYARKAVIVDGSDGKTYIAELSAYGFVTVMQSNMQFQAETVHFDNARFPEMLALFN